MCAAKIVHNKAVVDGLRALAPVEVSSMDGIAEHVEFRLPAALADPAV